MSGKYTEYGMTYQKRVLMYCFICLSSSYDTFFYENKDDVDCYNTNDCRHYYVQAKTGTLGMDEKINIIYNWISLKPSTNTIFSVFTKKNFSFNYEAIKKKVLENLKQGNTCREDSNIKKAYNACLVDGVYNEDKVTEFIDIIFNSKNLVINLDDDEIDVAIFNHYKDIKIHDDRYVDSQIEKHLGIITEKFLMNVFDYFKGDIVNKPPYVVNESLVDEWYECAKQQYGIKGYNRLLRDVCRSASPSLDYTKREVAQLHNLGLDNDTILDFLIDKIFYEDFKDFYSLNNDFDIDNIEHKAFTNYNIKRLGLDLTEQKVALDLFKDVISIKIDDDLIKQMNDSQYCSQGCYIYLTSNYAKAEYQITWIRKQ